MKANIVDNQFIRNCTSCGICASVCGVNAIRIDYDADGFLRPVVDEKKCVECGMCKRSCYKYDKSFVKSDDVMGCYAAWNKDANQLARSSSGGISRLLMEECIAQGYKVFGCVYDSEQNRAESITVSSVVELDQFYGSKYFQSYTVDGFSEIFRDRSNQKYAIFGTPCHIYAFSQTNKYKRNPERFLLVDIFCHGCPTVKLWNAYRHHQEQKLNVLKFEKIAFRSKTYGWHEYSIDFFTSTAKITSSKINDPFFSLFFGGDLMNHACYDCLARSTMAYTDIRIGDYWGPKYEMNTKGVSAVIVRSKLGNEIMSSIREKMVVEFAEFSNIISAQSYGKTIGYEKQRRRFLLSALNDNTDIHQIARDYHSMLPFKRRLKNNLKSLVKRLPRGIYFSVRKFLHSL